MRLRQQLLLAIVLSLLAVVVLPFEEAGAQQSPSASPCAPGGPAGQYPPTQRGMAVSRTAIESGGSFNVQGCASPRSQVTFTLFSHPAVLGTTVADNSGFYRATLSIPCDMEPGRHTLQTSGGAIEAATLEVTGATASACPAIQGQERARAAADQDLPRTGSSSVVPWVMVGAGLVAFGVVAVIVARRRRLHADL